jgi:hypothetical protein
MISDIFKNGDGFAPARGVPTMVDVGMQSEKTRK